MQLCLQLNIKFLYFFLTGGNSINQANPVPVINLVAALRNNAATIIKMINIARANEAEAK